MHYVDKRCWETVHPFSKFPRPVIYVNFDYITADGFN
jgi:hypothetical protein